MAISSIIAVNRIPKTRFRIRLIFGFRRIDIAIMIGGIAKTRDAINNFVGLSKIFSPVTRPSTFLGTYNSK